MTDILLHHYDISPYSEKIRCALGFKGLGWKSVEMPVTMPKPDLLPLTGGYRGAPVMQIGADIFCDTELMMAEIEARRTDPSLYPGGRGRGLSAIWNTWQAQGLFWSAARWVLAANAEALPPELHSDRAAMFAMAPPSIEEVKATAGHHRAQTEAHLTHLEDHVKGQSFLLGEAVSHADFSVYHPIWFATQFGFADILSDRFPAVAAWMERVGAFSDKTRSVLDPKEALAIAKAADPRPLEPSTSPDPAGLAIGQRIGLKPEAFGQEVNEGEIVHLSATRIVLRREHPAVGTVHVHFPRTGFVALPA